MPHAITDACHRFHCWYHDEDEAATTEGGWYRICHECRHLYRAPGELVEMYERWMRPQILRRTRISHPEPLPKPAEIRFCPLCAHDWKWVRASTRNSPVLNRTTNNKRGLPPEGQPHHLPPATPGVPLKGRRPTNNLNHLMVERTHHRQGTAKCFKQQKNASGDRNFLGGPGDAEHQKIAALYRRRASLVQWWFVRHGARSPFGRPTTRTWTEQGAPVPAVTNRCPECGSDRIFEQISITTEGCIDDLSCIWICDSCKSSGPVDIMGDEDR